MDCRGYGTPSLIGIPRASRCGYASLSRWKLRIPRRPPHVLFQTDLSDCSSVRVSALGRHSPI